MISKISFSLFFCTSETCFSIVTLINLCKSPLCTSLWFSEKKKHFVKREQAFFEKKYTCHYLTQNEFSNVSVCTFSYFRNLFFKSCSEQFQHLTYTHILLAPRCASTRLLEKKICFFLTKLRFQKLVFRFTR